MHNILKLNNFSKSGLANWLFICLLISFSSHAAGKFNAQNRYLYIQQGQSIFSIVKVIYPDQKKQWPAIIKKIVKQNPQAFIGADASKIQPGERLVLPSYSSNFKPVSSAKGMIYKGPQSVGQVIKSRGKTFAISKKDKQRNLQVGNEVFVGDRIFTGVKGFVRLSMIDDAKIDLRCNSEMSIEDYQLLRGGNRSVIYLIKGSVKKITGSIGKMADDVYELHTPLATVGVRGTEYAIRVLQSHGCDGSLDVNSQGLFVKVNKGAINVKSQSRETALNKGDTSHLADKNSELKNINARPGVFESISDGKKGYFFGSLLWLLWIAPVILILRKNNKNGN